MVSCDGLLLKHWIVAALCAWLLDAARTDVIRIGLPCE